jgi:hypothetical protein
MTAEGNRPGKRAPKGRRDPGFLFGALRRRPKTSAQCVSPNACPGASSRSGRGCAALMSHDRENRGRQSGRCGPWGQDNSLVH